MNAGISIPHIPPGTHPVERNQVLLLTPAINGLLNTLKIWLEGRLPGGLIYGVPRVGKTRAIRYLIRENELYSEFVPYISVTMRKIEPSTPRAFWAHLASQLKYPIEKGTTQNLWERVYLKLTETALNDNKDGLVLFINDAQKLTEHQYELLHDLHNILDDQNIYACFVLVGQTQLLNIRNGFKAVGMSEIVGRFMSVDYCMRGITNLEELSFVLEGYDENSEFPKESKCSYSQYFFPEIYQCGWRLANEASILWQAFERVHQESRMACKLEIPLQYVVHAINYGLCRNSCRDSSFPGFSLALWKQAILNAGYASAGSFLIAPEEVG
ncbi:ATP-binding protein [Pelobacter seleniigenes]|uniref:ATP-binding protein n=1 Tax=Pelobacter seleniigenes TaxID=407188 RepID=UPI0004A70377|nr:AAA family ATPase [Pelobacter seleniigenes]